MGKVDAKDGYVIGETARLRGVGRSLAPTPIWCAIPDGKDGLSRRS
ncbi:hypothetical protein ACWDTP_21225 [Mycobacterium sp. NPDC003449]